MKGYVLLLGIAGLAILVLARIIGPSPSEFRRNPNQKRDPMALTNEKPQPRLQTESSDRSAKILTRIEIELQQRYGHKPLKLKSALQTLRAFEGILNSPDGSLAAVAREAACRTLTFDALEGQELGRWLESEVFDTDEKFEAYLNWNSRLDGQLVESPRLERSVVCDAL